MQFKKCDFLRTNQRMEEWGNGRANELYEASVPSQVHRPKEGDSVRIVEKFIRDKYEHKRYMAKSIPPKVERTETVEDDDDDVPKRRTTRPRPVPAVQVATSVPVARAPAPAPAPVPVPVAAPQVSLIDFMEPIIEPTPVPAPTPVAQQSFDAFGPSGNFGFAQTPAQQFQQVILVKYALLFEFFSSSCFFDRCCDAAVFHLF